MCGRYNISSGEDAARLLGQLRVGEMPEARRNIAPGAHGQFVREQGGERELVDGIWSLLVEPKPSGAGFRPSPKFSTFNARSDRLEASPLWRGRYHHKRAIVPADGFHEWVGKQCYQVRQPGRALALGALYEVWEFGDVRVPSFSIITVPPHPRFAHIHAKSLPLLLEPADFELWLDPAFSASDAFRDLLQPRLRHTLEATPVDSPLGLHAVGETEVFPPD